ncbi:MAG TPA: HXXEE domain-containing protein [Pyrinomonadaceae bacterium]|nr:HXXEE domain-containing protein [Pyrinomonadaceae bacterium]
MTPVSAKENRFWPWLFPFTYLIHVVEELYGGEGYTLFLERLRDIHITPARFAVAHCIALALMILGIILARRLGFPNLFTTVLGTTVLVNGLTHTVQTIYYGDYVPGFVSGVAIWMPLGVATLVRFRKLMNVGRYVLAIALGVGINFIVELLILWS